jgi:hypothetical protein
MTQGQIARLDALPERTRAAIHYKRDGMPLAVVRGVLHGRAPGSAPSTPWVVAGAGPDRAVGYLSPEDSATVAVAGTFDLPEADVCVEL